MSFMSRSLPLTAAALVSITISSAPALSQDVDRMEQIVAAEADTGAFIGNVLVAVDGDIVFENSQGMANYDWQIPNSPNTRFRIGSVTKQFTAASILMLQERGMVDIEAPVATYWPEAPESWEAITVRQLLQHTSGIPNVTSLDGFATMKFLPTSPDELIATFSDLPLEFEPGERWSYSNSNYLILTEIVEDVSGLSYAEFVQTNIFDPLGMDSTGVDNNAAVVPHRATGYFPGGEGPRPADYVNMDIPQGAGALYSTTHDLLRWQQALFAGEVLEAESVELMTTPGLGNYALGVMIDDNNGRLVWHGGGIEGFNAWLGHDTSRDITVVVLANQNGGAANNIARDLVAHARGEEVSLPGERARLQLPTETLDEYVGTFAITADFKIAIFREGETLMTQATGQGAFPVYAAGDDVFYLEVVAAELHFTRDDDGTVTGLVLHQGGQEVPAIKE